MRATSAQCVLLLKGAALANLAELSHILDDDVAGLCELIAQRRVAEVGARHAVVDPPARLGLAFGNLGIDVGAHVREEGDDVMVRRRLNLVNLFLDELRMVTNPRSLIARDTNVPKLGLGLAGQNLDLLPHGILVLKREDVAHLRTGVAVDHDGGLLGLLVAGSDVQTCLARDGTSF